VTCSEPIIQGGSSTPTSRAEGGAERLLHDQAQSPRRQQGVERTPVETLDQRPFDEKPDRSGGDESNDHGDKEVSTIEPWQIAREQVRAEIRHVGAEDHELTVRHVDDAHLAEDDRQTERHEQVDREQNQAGEALHRQNRAEFTERIAEHRAAPRPG
jgi:hypothetical protein